MSAAAPQHLTHDGDSRSSVLPFPSVSLSLSNEVLLQRLANFEPEAIAELNSQPIPELVKLWKNLNKLECRSWVTKCAISVNIWDQTAAAKRGRGNKDIGERGILAAVSRTSKELDVTPSTIYLNARIFRLILQVQESNSFAEHNILEVLDQQGYWEHALSAADPIAAILEFAHRKATQKRFRTTDAQRLVLSEMSRKAAALKAVATARAQTGKLSAREELVAHIRFAQDIIKNQIIPACPDESFKQRVWEELLTELDEEHQELFDEDACNALRKAWDSGAHREDELVKATGFPIADVSRLMAVMSNLSEFIRIQPRDIKKRTDSQLWHKTGEPFDNAKYIPMVKRG